MKIFSAAGRSDKSRRAVARNCLIVNQFATPGLGSLMGGRIVAGSIQLALALGGFALVIIWILEKSDDMYREAYDLPTRGHHYPWLGTAGFLLFGVSWVLAWFTSLSLVRQAPREEPPGAIPPILPPPKL